MAVVEAGSELRTDAIGKRQPDMRALVLNGQGVAVVPNASEPEPRDGEVLVRVLRAGICETDLQLVQGYMGFEGVLGHEFVGIAESGRHQGRRVVGEINCACGQCAYCRAGLRNHCPHRSVLGILDHDGAFADYVAVPEENLHPVPDEIPTEAAVFTEPLAAACEIPAQIELGPKQQVVVLGDGRLGNLCAQVAALHGCSPTVVGKHAEKLAHLEQAGIETALLDDAQPGRAADVVIDCTGSPTGLPTALQFVRPRGTVVMKTTVAGEHTVALAPVVIDEITLVGSRCGPFPPAIEALRSGRIDVRPLISASFPLDNGVEALDKAQSESVLKLLLSME